MRANNQLAMFEIRCKYAVVSGQVGVGPRHQRSQSGDEREWFHHDMGGAVTKEMFKLVDDLTLGVN